MRIGYGPLRGRNRWTAAGAAFGMIAGLLGCAERGQVAFLMHAVNADSPFEGAGVTDVNRDGKPDIVCGGFWYEASSWKKHFVREVKAEGGYHHDFCDLPIDVNGDGWTDIVTASWHGRRLSWIRHPGKPDGPFEEIAIDEPGNMEAALLVDVNHDGQLDVLPNIMGQAAWYEFRRDASAPQGVRWIKHELPKEVAGHGIGAGDVNGDGRCDVVGPAGWLEQPAKTDGTWQWHPEFDLGGASVPIVVYDVDSDGDADLIWGMGHNYGVYWLEQYRSATGERLWCKREIDHDWSQAHVVLLGDLDGDREPEIVTGKRYWAHNGHDPGERDPRCLYWYRFDRVKREWQRHTIQEGGQAGIGTWSELADVDRDGDLDLVAAGKSGLYLFENLQIP